LEKQKKKKQDSLYYFSAEVEFGALAQGVYEGL